MEARPAPRTVACPTWRAALGFCLEWLRLLLVGRTATSWHLRLSLAWPSMAIAVVLLVARPIEPGVVGGPAEPAEAVAPVVEEGAPVDAPVALDLSPLSRSRMFPAPVRTTRPKQSAIVPDLGNELQLHGVIGGENPRAIIFHKRTQQTHSVRVGQEFGEFEVIEIHSMRVILRWRDETIELSI